MKSVEKDLNLQIHLHKAFFSDNQFFNSVHKSFLNQTTLDLRKEKWSFLNREFTVFENNFTDFREAVSLEKIFEIVQENTLKCSKLIHF